MIEVTRFNGSNIIINCEQIEFVEETPDTAIHLLNGKVFIVKESSEEIIKKVVEYKQEINKIERVE